MHLLTVITKQVVQTVMRTDNHVLRFRVFVLEKFLADPFSKFDIRVALHLQGLEFNLVQELEIRSITPTTFLPILNFMDTFHFANTWKISHCYTALLCRALAADCVSPSMYNA